MGVNDFDDEDLFEYIINTNIYSISGSRMIVLSLDGYDSFKECLFLKLLRVSASLAVLNGGAMMSNSSRKIGFIVCNKLLGFCSRSYYIRSQKL